jgi:hypothetical protein
VDPQTLAFARIVSLTDGLRVILDLDPPHNTIEQVTHLLKHPDQCASLGDEGTPVSLQNELAALTFLSIQYDTSPFVPKNFSQLHRCERTVKSLASLGVVLVGKNVKLIYRSLLEETRCWAR